MGGSARPGRCRLGRVSLSSRQHAPAAAHPGLVVGALVRSGMHVRRSIRHSFTCPRRAAPVMPSSGDFLVRRGFDLQGHRGARGLLPENSWPAFERALELGVTTLELDVVVSGDGRLVVSHDPWFSALFCSLPSGEPIPAGREREYRLYAMAYEEIVRYDCGRRGHPLFPQQQPVPAAKPLLREVLRRSEAAVHRLGRRPVWYNIETKARPEWDGVFTPSPEAFTRLLHDELEALGVKQRTTLQSFDPRTLCVARALDPRWELSLLAEWREEAQLEADLEGLGFLPEIYSPDYRLVDEALVGAVHAHGMRLVPWTVNDEATMLRLHALGVDGLITDYPDVGVRLFGKEM